MSLHLPRKNSVETMLEAFEWLKRNPVLILLFLVVGLVDGLGEASTVFSILGFLLIIFADGVAHRFAFAEVRGESTTIGDEIDPVLGRLLSLIGATVIYVVAVAIGLILLIVPGIYLALRLSLAFPAIVIDDENAFEGLETSWNVAHGNLLKLLGITLLAFLVVFSTAIVAAIFSVALESIVFAVAVGTIVTGIVGPIVQLSYARVYLENRESGLARSTDRWSDDQSRPAGHTQDDDWGTDENGDWGTTDDDWNTGGEDRTTGDERRETDDEDDDRNLSW